MRPPEPREARAFVWVGLRTAGALAGTTENTNSLPDLAFRDSRYSGAPQTCLNTRQGALGAQRQTGGPKARKCPHRPTPPDPSTLPVSADNCCWAPRRKPPGAPPDRSGAPGANPRPPPRRPEPRLLDPRRFSGRPAPGGRWVSQLPCAGRAPDTADAPLTLGSGPARSQQQRGQQRQERPARPAAARPVHSSSRGGGGGGDGGSQAARRTSTGSARGPGHLVPAALPAGCRGRLQSSLSL